jgi:chemotaxis signal transduction protein
MPKQATELTDAISHLAAGYERWLTELSQSTAADTASEDRCDAQSLLAWVGAVNTSSEVLLEILEGIRTNNEPLLSLCSKTVGSGSNRDSVQLSGNESRARGLEVLRLLSTLKERIAEGLLEDQRLIVVEQANSLFALTVDRVREVRSLPPHVITASLRLSSVSDSAKFRGVANLDDGKRLILLLEPRQLVNPEWFEVAKHALEGEEASAPDPLAEGEHRAEPDAAERDGDSLFVVFRLAEGDYGLPIQAVCEIGRYVRATTVPTAAAHVDGVMNLRGEVVPVVNARRRLALPTHSPDEHTRLIFVQVGETKTALVVDSVARVARLNQNEIVSPPDATYLEIEQDCIAGVATRAAGEPLLVLLDAAAFVESSLQVEQ